MNKKRPPTVTRIKSCADPGLDREAERLLAALEAEGAYGLPDPTLPDRLIVRRDVGGISLGAGTHAARAGKSLAGAGLVEPLASRPDHLAISAAGRARLARRRAPGDSAFLAQHLALTRETGDDAGLLRDASESPLAWMARRRGRDGKPLIDAASVEAGERLRRDITQGGMLPRLTADWGAPRVDGSGPRDPASASDRMVAARQRARRALDAVGTDMAGLLIDLCAFLKGLEAIERERGWPPRSAKVVIRLALARLAEHYGLGREASGPNRARLRLWRDPTVRTACG